MTGVTEQNEDPRSPKKACNEYRNVLIERNFLKSPVKDRAFHSPKSKVPLQSAFARLMTSLIYV